MKTIVIYNSQTGFTKRYAEWIAEATGADCLELSAAKKKDLAAYEAIIFGGWACAGSISKISWFKGNIDKWADKKLVAFFVGGSPIDNPGIDVALKRNFNESEQKKVKIFYCPGGFNYEKMSTPSRACLKNQGRRLIMRKFNLSSKQIITWICVNYGLFILAFFTLGFIGNIKSVVIVNFALDVVLCVVSFVLNIRLFSTKYKTPIVGKIGLLFATLCFAAFTYFAFLMPENGLPPVLFS